MTQDNDPLDKFINDAAFEDAKRDFEQEQPQATSHETDDNLNEESLDYDAFSDDIHPLHEQNEATSNKEPNEDQVRIGLLEGELERTKDQLIRTLAETENIRKRSIKERDDASKFAVSNFSKDLINVADNLRRALDSFPQDSEQADPQIKGLIDGIEATERELLRSFEKNGIQKIEPLDERFDPNFHEVMFEAPMPDKPTGNIIQVIEAGYIINGRILRPARVGIANEQNHWN